MSTTAETPAPEISAKEKRRREILDAAFEEFSAKGYSGTSMEAIARRAHASKETLYAWFQNKETLLNTVFATRMERMTRRANAEGARDDSPEHLLPIIAEDTIRFMLAMAPLGRGIEIGEAGEATLKLLGQTIAEERTRFVDYLLRRKAAGDIAFDDDPFELASLFVAMAEGEWSMRLDTGMLDELTDQMIEEHARRVTRMFLKGLAPER